MNHITILREIQTVHNGVTTDDLIPERLKKKPISSKSLKEAIKIALGNTFYETNALRKFKDVHVSIKSSSIDGSNIQKAVDYVLLQCSNALDMPQWIRDDWGNGNLLDIFDKYRLAIKVLKIQEQHNLITGEVELNITMRIFHAKYRNAHDAVTPLLLQAIKSRIDFYKLIPSHASKADNAKGNLRYMEPIYNDLKVGCYPSIGKAYMLWKLDETNFWTHKFRPADFVDKIPDNFWLHFGLLLRQHKFNTRAWAIFDREGNQNKDMEMRFQFLAYINSIVAGWDKWVAAGNEDDAQLPRDWLSI